MSAEITSTFGALRGLLGLAGGGELTASATAVGVLCASAARRATPLPAEPLSLAAVPACSWRHSMYLRTPTENGVAAVQPSSACARREETVLPPKSPGRAGV